VRICEKTGSSLGCFLFMRGNKAYRSANERESTIRRREERRMAGDH